MIRSLVTVAAVACLLAPTQATGSSLSPNAADETHRDGSPGAFPRTLGELFKSSGSSDTAATADTERNLIATGPLFYTADGELRMFGCFADRDPRDMALTWKTLDPGSKTLAKCAAYCKTQGTKFFAMQAGYACFCSDHYGTYGPSTNCNVQCDDGIGNCGGGLANYVGMLTPTNPGTNTKATFCMADTWANRDMAPNWTVINSGPRSMTACANLCKPPGSKGTTFFGMQAGFACFCSDGFGSLGTASNCDLPCSDGSGMCGGSLSNSVGFVNGWTQGLNNGCFKRPTTVASCPTGTVPSYDRTYSDPSRVIVACVTCPTDDAYDIAFPVADGSGNFYCGRVNTCPDYMKKVTSAPDSVQCLKFSYGRGNGYSSSAWGQCLSENQSLGCELCGGWAYPKCTAGYKNNDAGTCDSCSNCSFCYKNCPAGYTETQSMCFSKKSAPVAPLWPNTNSVCANTPYPADCNIFCARDGDACNAIWRTYSQQTGGSSTSAPLVNCGLSALAFPAVPLAPLAVNGTLAGCVGSLGVKDYCTP